MKNQNNLDGNIITWALVTPFGKVSSNFNTRLKRKGFMKGVAHMRNYAMHFPTIEAAKEFCASLKESKTSFSSMYITDKQFGQIELTYA